MSELRETTPVSGGGTRPPGSPAVPPCWAERARQQRLVPLLPAGTESPLRRAAAATTGTRPPAADDVLLPSLTLKGEIPCVES